MKIYIKSNSNDGIPSADELYRNGWSGFSKADLHVVVRDLMSEFGISEDSANRIFRELVRIGDRKRGYSVSEIDAVVEELLSDDINYQGFEWMLSRDMTANAREWLKSTYGVNDRLSNAIIDLYYNGELGY